MLKKVSFLKFDYIKISIKKIIPLFQVLLLSGIIFYSFFYFSPQLDPITKDMQVWDKTNQLYLLSILPTIITLGNMVSAGCWYKKKNIEQLRKSMLCIKIGSLVFQLGTLLMIGFHLFILALGGYRYIPDGALVTALLVFCIQIPFMMDIAGAFYGILLLILTKKNGKIKSPAAIIYAILLWIPILDMGISLIISKKYSVNLEKK